MIIMIILIIPQSVNIIQLLTGLIAGPAGKTVSCIICISGIITYITSVIVDCYLDY